MSNLAIFAEYAAAFEETLRDDNWARLEKYFAADTCYLPGDGTEGARPAGALAALRRSVDLLERKTDSRELVGEPNIEEEGDRITLFFDIRLTHQLTAVCFTFQQIHTAAQGCQCTGTAGAFGAIAGQIT
ncbi:MAG: hypothetical protein AAF529_14650, partial [Pseudomonadota bacterium]